MTIVLINKPLHGSLDWLKLRHKYEGRTIVGGSEVSAVMGANPYKSVNDLAIEKMQTPVVREANPAMKRGTFLEQGLLDYQAAEEGINIWTPDTMYLRERIIVTLDGQSNDCVYEAKTTTSWMAGDDCLPEWFWQAQAQMYCTHATFIRFVVLDRQLRISTFDVPADVEAQQHMADRVEAFCNAIDNNQMPSDEPLTYDQITALYPNPAGEVEIGAAGLELVERWNALKAAIKDLSEQESNVKNALAALLGKHDAGTIDGQRIITFKAQQRESFDNKSFAAAHPDLAKQYARSTSFRVLRTVKGSTNG